MDYLFGGLAFAALIGAQFLGVVFMAAALDRIGSSDKRRARCLEE
jgi:hypothetical protein